MKRTLLLFSLIATLGCPKHACAGVAPTPTTLDELYDRISGANTTLGYPRTDIPYSFEGMIVTHIVGDPYADHLPGVTPPVGGLEISSGHMRAQCDFVSVEELRKAWKVPNGTKVRIIGYYRRMDGDVAIPFVRSYLDPSYRIVTDESASLGSDSQAQLLKELGTPFERKAVKKAALKDKKEYGDMILQAAKGGDWDTMKEAIDEGGLINTADSYNGANALTFVIWGKMAKDKKRELVQYVLERGCDIPMNGNLSTVATVPIAAQTGDIELVKLVLRAGANPKEKITMGPDGLTVARENGYGDIAALLSMVIKITGGAPIDPATFGQQSGGQAAATTSASSADVGANPNVNQSVTQTPAAPSGAVPAVGAWNPSAPAVSAGGNVTTVNWAQTKMQQGFHDMMQGTGTMVLQESVQTVLPPGASILIPNPTGKIGTPEVAVALVRWVNGKIPYSKLAAGYAWPAQNLQIPVTLSNVAGGVQVSFGQLGPGDYALIIDTQIIAFHVN